MQNSSGLKELFNENDTKLYIKPDKTKAERDENFRMGKHKQELLTQHLPLKGKPLELLTMDCYHTPQT